jgi:hypothetical protein
MSNAINTSPNVAILDKPNQFPWKLYDMLDIAERRNEEHIISWIKDGKAFKVHSRDLFIEQYMKKMFNQTKFKSFQRQLNLWGFERVQNGPDKGSYFHPLFVKGQKDWCQRLSRVRLRGIGDKTVQHGSLNTSETTFSPHSASSTAPETISTTGAAIFPVTVTVSSVVGAGKTSTASPISLLGAFVDVSRPTSTTTAETSFHGDSRQQFADLIQYHISEQRREMIRNAAIGLSPDLSIAVVGTPVFATTVDTSQRDAGEEDLQRHQEEEYKQQEHALLPRHQIEKQQKVEQREQICLLQQQQQERIQLEQQPQIDREQQPHRRSTSSGLEALLSVSAQRRREEELALLMGLSNYGAMSHTR